MTWTADVGKSTTFSSIATTLRTDKTAKGADELRLKGKQLYAKTGASLVSVKARREKEQQGAATTLRQGLINEFKLSPAVADTVMGNVFKGALVTKQGAINLADVADRAKILTDKSIGGDVAFQVVEAFQMGGLSEDDVKVFGEAAAKAVQNGKATPYEAAAAIVLTRQLTDKGADVDASLAVALAAKREALSSANFDKFGEAAAGMVKKGADPAASLKVLVAADAAKIPAEDLAKFGAAAAKMVASGGASAAEAMAGVAFAKQLSGKGVDDSTSLTVGVSAKKDGVSSADLDKYGQAACALVKDSGKTAANALEGARIADLIKSGVADASGKAQTAETKDCCKLALSNAVKALPAFDAAGAAEKTVWKNIAGAMAQTGPLKLEGATTTGLLGALSPAQKTSLGAAMADRCTALGAAGDVAGMVKEVGAAVKNGVGSAASIDALKIHLGALPVYGDAAITLAEKQNWLKAGQTLVSVGVPENVRIAMPTAVKSSLFAALQADAAAAAATNKTAQLTGTLAEKAAAKDAELEARRTAGNFSLAFELAEVKGGDQAKLNTMFGQIENNQIIKDAIANWGTDANLAAETAAMKEVIKIYAQNFGWAPVADDFLKVYKNDTLDGAKTAGYSRAGLEELFVNTGYRDYRDPADVVNTMVHELTHVHQTKLAKSIEDGSLAPAHADYPRAVIFHAANKCVHSTGALANCGMNATDADAIYRGDPTEVHAYDVGDKSQEKFNEILARWANP